ncbi:hypothetical protein HYPSUDRAFT_1021369 [Hypholoma sublateritium FD-334 SS-4]|uniref:Uncharacterized protein n=1 Tax=Hypholoma sublateritium (strain FD-334 SS-4) TaxID=945553 RepID=A0A0D2NEA5_HYPSF|nr:hypothetical protein HYPSUDRAFT_1021369 [Hypholoma sublateritium FD-334 SS-4]
MLKRPLSNYHAPFPCISLTPSLPPGTARAPPLRAPSRPHPIAPPHPLLVHCWSSLALVAPHNRPRCSLVFPTPLSTAPILPHLPFLPSPSSAGPSLPPAPHRHSPAALRLRSAHPLQSAPAFLQSALPLPLLGLQKRVPPRSSAARPSCA